LGAPLISIVATYYNVKPLIKLKIVLVDITIVIYLIYLYKSFFTYLELFKDLKKIMNDLSLIIPAKNEPESLPYVLKELEKLKLNFFVLMEKNDYVTINAIEKYKSNIIFQKNKGFGDAVNHGLENVKTKYFLIFNADGSMDPNEIPRFIEKFNKHETDLVFASRYLKNGESEDDTIITFIGNKLFSLIGKIFFSLELSDILYTYVMGKTKEVQNLNLKNKDFRFCVELPIKAKRNKLKIEEISSKEKRRIGGYKKVNDFKDGFLILLEIMRLYFNRKE
jgi:glycosyltransferase involved in cell wall biosynthesis